MSLYARLYLLVITVLLLATLAVCLFVLVGIVREGRERSRERRTGETEPYTPDPEYDAGPPSVLDGEQSQSPEAVTCPHCGTDNEPEFAFCARCARPL
ncbi:DUF7577 domain-containing protein [Halorientalis salina]|uniref:DUF7577 domain-containing protein n=1 Tax=Halorientalis salina TaxID=2932266 RepID=UPI0010AD180B|nr:zinc-ribbon domain-containing protein [Halorientalis salina]